MALVTLTTDFGTADGYVGAIKGVILTLAPGTVVVDVAHDVPRHDVAHAAWVLATSAWMFPLGTIHLCVVDPGVGGARNEIVVAARGHLFVGPDNGVFALVGDPCEGAWAITSAAFHRPQPSPTFHGRDVFAPAAAALARGLPPHLAGPATCSTVSARDTGVIVHVDAYGNLISDLRGAAQVRIAGRVLDVKRTYEDVAPGELVAYVGSAGTIEIAVREGSAASVLGLARGARVEPS
ncbi:MAG TPA: SAM-dependent chlorinase/fluorinase [Kofleriaceae bacterium]|nr:SAM-dependent chlorinase/fluorinase [Kofleriaceae bacterium]